LPGTVSAAAFGFAAARLDKGVTAGDAAFAVTSPAGTAFGGDTGCCVAGFALAFAGALSAVPFPDASAVDFGGAAIGSNPFFPFGLSKDNCLFYFLQMS